MQVKGEVEDDLRGAHLRLPTPRLALDAYCTRRDVEGAEALAIIGLRPSNPDALGTLLVVGVLQPSAQIAADL